ncbi:hypothetical protein AVEN_156709-1 [Araneus ventricosus]|uniref:Uncharacterized protein n=1 Tax=Araneus ventricosus TaxID=182803 RepID=A0A4Y2J9J6_ARAVE|nr:hypothetical protein AVEN_156709-1 [Araneus ventricosus]
MTRNAKKKSYLRLNNRAMMLIISKFKKKKLETCLKVEYDNLNDKNLSIDKETNIPKQKDLIPILPKAIEEHDIELLKFDPDTGKPVISDSLRLQILKLSSIYFKNSEGPL